MNSAIVVFDEAIMGPRSLSISDHASSEEVLVWWNAVKLYHETMASVGRVVILSYVDDEEISYALSIPEEFGVVKR